VAYTHKESERSSGFGLLDSVSLGDAAHQPRLSALFHRLGHLRNHSITCSSCGPIERSYWFCSHCHLSLCANCWSRWHYPEAADNTIGEASRTLCPSSSCQAFRPPLHRAPFSDTIVAGGANDLSHLHIPVVVVAVLGTPATKELPLSQTLEYTARDFSNTAGYGCFNFRIATNTSGSTVKALKTRVDAICALVRDCYAGRFVLDLRAHWRGGRYEFEPHLFTAAELFVHLIKPIVRAFRAAQRLTRGRYPAFDSSRAAVAASRILVVFHCCDTEFTTFLQLLDEFLASDNIALELLLFQKPLLLKDMNILLPAFMHHYTNALCPLSTFDLLEQTTSPAQRHDFIPTLLSPRPGSKQYHVRVLGAAPRAPLSLANRLPPGGLAALSRRSDPFGAYAPPAVESLVVPAASRSVARIVCAPRPSVVPLAHLLLFLCLLLCPVPPPRALPSLSRRSSAPCRRSPPTRSLCLCCRGQTAHPRRRSRSSPPSAHPFLLLLLRLSPAPNVLVCWRLQPLPPRPLRPLPRILSRCCCPWLTRPLLLPFPPPPPRPLLCCFPLPPLLPPTSCG
jgi:hypothetical protein